MNFEFYKMGFLFYYFFKIVCESKGSLISFHCEVCGCVGWPTMADSTILTACAGSDQPISPSFLACI